nr:DNA topoisomerase 2 [Tanacetum cinerariifolium]
MEVVLTGSPTMVADTRIVAKVYRHDNGGNKNVFYPSSEYIKFRSKLSLDIYLGFCSLSEPPRGGVVVVVDVVGKWWRCKAMLDMLPWYRGFKGKIQQSASNEYTTYGIITMDKDNDALIITELPVRSWTLNYYEFLKAALRGGKY